MQKRSILCVLVVMMAFSGCMASSEDPYLVDTVIKIPMNPTEEPLPETIAEPETESFMEVATKGTEPAEMAEKKPASTQTASRKGTSSKKTASSKTPSATSKPKETKPAAMVPPTQTPTIMPTTAPTAPPFDPASYVPGSLEYDLLAELNVRRTADGISKLELCDELSGIAAIRAWEISNTWSSTRPDGRSYTSVMEDHGYGFTAAAQLLIHTAGSGDAPALVDRWMGIDTSHANILSCSFDTAGIGLCRTGGVIYIACILTD